MEELKVNVVERVERVEPVEQVERVERVEPVERVECVEPVERVECVERVKSVVELNINIEEEKDDVNIKEIKVQEMQSFLKLFEIFLTQYQSFGEKFSIKLTPEIQQYFLLLCKEFPELFSSFEETLKKIILDDKIDSKDIPDILVLVSMIYKIVKENKGVPTVDSYELIKTLIHLGFIVYIETNNVKNKEAVLDILRIIDASIDLIKLSPIIPKKGWLCFRC